MQRYIIHRVLYALFSLFGLSILVFVLLRAVPGDAAIFLVGGDSTATQAQLDAVRAKLGLNEPLPIQYVDWAGHMLRGDFGRSLFTNETVVHALGTRLPVSLELGLIAMTFAITIAFPVGIFSAILQDSATDQVLRFLSILGLAIPNFWLGTMVVIFGSRWFGWIPPVGYVSIFSDPWKNLQQFIIPSIVLGAALGASLTRMMRSSVLEVMREDYIRTARAKGLTNRNVIRVHMLRNALIPVITLFGIQFGIVVGGTVVIENIFNLPGMGRLILDAINRRDYPLVQGVVLAFGFAILLINLLTDLAYGWLDPRITYD